MRKVKDLGIEYNPQCFENVDTPKQLLAESRYLLFKSANKWTASQRQRVKMIFKIYPYIKEGDRLAHSLRQTFNKNSIKDAARLSLALWYDKVEKTGFKNFKVIGNTLYENNEQILNFFIKKTTNAFAESFNAKTKVLEQA